MATHSSILAWDSHGWRNLAGYSPWDHKKSGMTEQPNNNQRPFSFVSSWPPSIIFRANNCIDWTSASIITSPSLIQILLPLSFIIKILVFTLNLPVESRTISQSQDRHRSLICIVSFTMQSNIFISSGAIILPTIETIGKSVKDWNGLKTKCCLNTFLQVTRFYSIFVGFIEFHWVLTTL